MDHALICESLLGFDIMKEKRNNENSPKLIMSIINFGEF